MHDDLLPGHHGAFVRDGHGLVPAEATGDGPLAGLRLAVKDVFDVQGLRTGAGNPAWRAARPLATRSALAVRRLLAGGATWAGRTVTDELTYSLAGINAHYGTPVNPASPSRIPGGSSSGSVVAVASGDADIALGTDCGGSVRLPASYCGVWGMRPTHGRIAADGCFTLAHSFDTVGWFARGAEPLARVFAQLAHTTLATDGPSLVWVSHTLGPLLDAPLRDAWDSLLAGPRPLSPAFGLARVPEGLERQMKLADWAAAFRTLQAAEVWQQHGDWFGAHGHSLGDDVRGRFERAALVTPAEVLAAQRVRVAANAVMAMVLALPGSLLLLPTVPTVAPKLDDTPARIDDVRQRAQQLLCIAGLAGLPQVSVPWTTVDGAPVGLSLVGARGDDETVLAAAALLGTRITATTP